MRCVIFVPLGTGDTRQLGECIRFRGQSDEGCIGIARVQACAEPIGEVGDGVIGHARTRRRSSSAAILPTNVRATHYPGFNNSCGEYGNPNDRGSISRGEKIAWLSIGRVIDNQSALAMIARPERGAIAAIWDLCSKLSASSSFSACMYS